MTNLTILPCQFKCGKVFSGYALKICTVMVVLTLRAFAKLFQATVLSCNGEKS